MSIKKNIIFNYIGVIVPIILNFTMVPVFIKYLGASAYGLIGISTLIQTWVMLLNSALSPVVGRCAAQAVVGEVSWSSVGKLCRSIDWMLFIFLGVIFTSCFFYMDEIVSIWFGNNIKTEIPLIKYCFMFLILTTLLRLATSIGRGLIQHLDAQVWLNIQMSIFNVFRFCGAIVIAYTLKDIFVVFLFWFLLSVLEYISVQFKVYSMIPCKINWFVIDVKLIKSQRKIIFPLLMTGFAYAVITNYDKVLLSAKLTLNEYGYYSLIVLLSSSVILISSPITQAFQPRIIRAFSGIKMGLEDKNSVVTKFRLMTAIVAIIISPVAAMMTVNGKEIIFSWSGANLSSETITALVFYALGNAFSVFSSLLYLLQLGKGDLRLHVIGYCLLLALLVPLYQYLVPDSSLVNVALAWFCVNVAYFIIWGSIIFKKIFGEVLVRWFALDIILMLILAIVFVYLISKMLIPIAVGRVSLFIILAFIGVLTVLFMAGINPLVRREFCGRKQKNNHF